MEWLVQVTVVLALAFSGSSSESFYVYIVPVDSADDLCLKYQNGTCFVLEQFVQTDLMSGGDSLTLNFLPGEHLLNQSLIITGYRQVQIIGEQATIVMQGKHSVIKMNDINWITVTNFDITSEHHISIEPLSIRRVLFVSFIDSHLNGTSLGIRESDQTVMKRVRFRNLESVIFIESENVLFENCSYTESQSLYTVSRSTVVTGCDFTNNYVYTAYGLINMVSGSLTVTNSTFTNNSCPISTAVSCKRCNLSISYCSFLSNSAAEVAGGAVIIIDGNGLISNCLFSNNKAQAAGAILTISSQLTVTDSNFTYNKANGEVDFFRLQNALKYDYQNFTYPDNLNASMEYSYNSIKGGGAILIWSGEVNISGSIFTLNTLVNELTPTQVIAGGGGIIIYSGTLSIDSCNLTRNSAMRGGVIHVGHTLVSHSLRINIAGKLRITNSLLTHNFASSYGGGIFIWSGEAIIVNTHLSYNKAFYAGAIDSRGELKLSNSQLLYNEAQWLGGAIGLYGGNTTISDSIIEYNKAQTAGGVSITAEQPTLTIQSTSLSWNTAASGAGGAINIESGQLHLLDCQLYSNRAETGAAVYAKGFGQIASVHVINSTFEENNATSDEHPAALYFHKTFLRFSGLLASNHGGIYALKSKLYFEQIRLLNNYGKLGGGIGTVQSEIYFENFNESKIVNNTAVYGGGIFLRESTLYTNSSIEISHNRAQNGGGVYAYLSSVKVGSEIMHAIFHIFIANNEATTDGGGLFLVSSILELSNSILSIESNRAVSYGGGVNLQQNSRIYLMKYAEQEPLESNLNIGLVIQQNSADYGGGIYIADDTELGGLCKGKSSLEDPTLSECLIQTLYLNKYYKRTDLNYRPNLVNIFMTKNMATYSGTDIYGGLLDRCNINPLSEYRNASSGWHYVQKTFSNFSSSGDVQSVSSEPVQVIFCSNSHQNIHVQKGGSFRISVTAVDQVGHPVNATIHSSVVTRSGVGRLKEGQAQQTVSNQCTEIEYNVFSRDSSAQVELYAEGPCINLGISKQTMNTTFLPCTCPIGLQPTHNQSDIDCQCDCDPVLQQHQISVCSQEEGTIQLENDPNIWIGVVNTTNGTGYVISSCPFDYCVEKPVNISLSSSNEIDRQCAYNRSGVLCGECQQGLSLVFATSNCQQCSNLFLLLLIPFALAGIALVAFILLLNITIAMGTIHGLIFYANIIAANKETFMPFSNFLTVFISWVNLDLGIGTCFYNGMSSQAKVLLQLVFPAYLFLLIFLIIIVSKYSSWFARLLSTRNPIAALATLILLSYSKLIRFIIAALQYTVLDHPDDEQQVVWLYDGNVQYFAPDHIPRLVAAAIILTAGGLFTVLLFFGQWLPRCSNWKLMKWTRNTKYIAFMDAYHSPFTPKHRYWLGLLLFVLIVQNIISAMSLHSVLTTGCLSVGIYVFKSLNNRVYKSRFNDILETLFLLNLVILALSTLKVEILKNNSQDALANVSLSIVFVQFLVIVAHHFYKFVLKKNPALQMNLPRDAIQNRIVNFQHHHHQHEEMEELVGVWNYEPREIPPGEDDPDRYITPPIVTPATRPDQLREPALDILAPITTEDYRQASPTPQDNRPLPVTHTLIEAI